MQEVPAVIVASALGRRQIRQTAVMPAAVEVSRAREKAYQLLLIIGAKRVDPAAILHESVSSLSTKDRALTQELVYGVLRWRGRLDFVLSHHSNRGLEALSPPVREILRLGAYQIMLLDRIPHRAAVDESVRLAKRHAPKASFRYVNAVLRSLCRSPEHPKLPGRDDPLAFLSITLSHPKWLAERYLDRLGQAAAEARAEWQNQRPMTYVRVGPATTPAESVSLLEQEGIEATTVESIPSCIRVEGGNIQDTAHFRAGGLRIQDAGSQLISCLVRPEPGERVLDACAAPGGKAQAITERHPESLVIASDVSFSRIQTLRKLGAESSVSPHRGPLSMVGDMTSLGLRARFPWILCDAPCSNLGTLSRNPDIKWSFKPKQFQQLARQQRKAILELAELLDSGGRLIYATCSTESEENEEVVTASLDRRSELVLEDARDLLPERAHGFVDEHGFLRVLPEKHGMDGYFAAVLKRRSGA